MSPRRYDLEAIKRDLSILDVAAMLGIKVHSNKAPCFGGHDKKSQSLTFTPAKNLWHCFGCGKGGSNIDLVMEVRGLAFPEAVDWLATAFGLWLPDAAIRARRNVRGASAPRQNHAASETSSDESPKCQPDPEVYGWFLSKCSISSRAISYLQEERGFTRETIEQFGIRDLTSPPRAFSNSIRKWGVDRLVACGLVKRVETSPRNPAGVRLAWWDYTLLFPFLEGDRVVYIQGRRLGDKQPKYVNLVGVRKPMFNRNILSSLRRGATVYICEGIPDTLAASQHGWNAVGVLGATSFSADWVGLFENFKVVVVPDRDQAGALFARKVQQLFKSHGQIVESAVFPSGKDLCEYLNPV